TNGLLNRWNLAVALVGNTLPGVHVDINSLVAGTPGSVTPSQLVDRLTDRILHRQLTAADRSQLLAYAAAGVPAGKPIPASTFPAPAPPGPPPRAPPPPPPPPLFPGARTARRTAMTFSRRSFLTSLGALSLPAWFPRLAFAAKPEARSAARDVLVCVFQRGGADGLNVVVPHAESAYHDARPSLKIPDPGATNGAIDLDGFFGLHPSLAPFKELWDEGTLAVVHAVGSPDANHSHFASMDVIERGTPSNQVTSGWIGRHLSSLANGNSSPFRAVGFGALLQASLRGPVSATALQSIVDFHLKGRHGMTQSQLAQFQTTLTSLYSGGTFADLQGTQTFTALTQLAKANPGQYQPENGAQYPTSDFGKGLLQVAQIIKA